MAYEYKNLVRIQIVIVEGYNRRRVQKWFGLLQERPIQSLAQRFFKNNFEALNEGHLNAYWARKDAQYKTLQAAYVRKQIQAQVSKEIDVGVMNDISNKKSHDQQHSKPGKRRKTSYESDEEEEDDKDLDDQDETPKSEEKRKYVLDFLEIIGVHAGELAIKTTEKFLPLEDRLNLSFIDLSNNANLPDFKLSSNSYAMIESWKKAIDSKANFYTQNPPPQSKEEMAIGNILSSLFLIDQQSMRETGKTVRFKHLRSEIDFIVKFVSILIQNTFSSNDSISTDWDTSSFALQEEVPKQFKSSRPDIIIICKEGVEVGCGEVKPPHKRIELINIDRARVAEICKRQLHLRLTTSVSPKELCTFGILIGGMTLELTKLEFDDGNYKYSVLKTIELTDRTSSYKDIEVTLEHLFSFKSIIEDSPSEGDISSSAESLYTQYFDLLKPTARFLH